MNTEYVTQRAKHFEWMLDSAISGPFIDRVVRKEWPKELDSKISTLVFSRVVAPTATPVKHTLREYRLQNFALQSGYIPDEASARYVFDTLEGLKKNTETVWENRFCHDICRLIENREIREHEDEVPPGPDLISLEYAPRKSLFGRTILRHRRTSLASGFHVELNPKYDRCPRQVLDFHPDTVHFLFPDLSKWAGEVSFKEVPKWQGETDEYPYVGRRFFRVVMSVAAKPVRTDLGTLYTILPSGVRGWLYKVVWKLLGVKP